MSPQAGESEHLSVYFHTFPQLKEVGRRPAAWQQILVIADSHWTVQTAPVPRDTLGSHKNQISDLKSMLSNTNIGEHMRRSLCKMILSQFIRVNWTLIDPNIKKFLFTLEIFSKIDWKYVDSLKQKDWMDKDVERAFIRCQNVSYNRNPKSLKMSYFWNYWWFNICSNVFNI